jgi:thymidylate synthase ThyX
MKTEVNVVLDSYINGVRVTTVEMTIPRIVLAELNTHRVFSRNSGSSRATPFNKILKSICFRPSVWRMNGSGMQPKMDAGFIRSLLATIAWEKARLIAIAFSFFFNKVLKIHKELSNRLMEPFQYTKVLVTSTEYQNFLVLRTHRTAQLEIREAAILLAEALDKSKPQERVAHLPYITSEELEEAFVKSRQGNLRKFFEVIMASVARCARVSYLNFEGRKDIDKDVDLFTKLAVQKPPHLSPLEHIVFNAPFAFEVLVDANDYIEKGEDLHGNLDARVVQYRKLMERKGFAVAFLERWLKMPSK